LTVFVNPALASIEENIRKGIDYEGKKFSYSDKDFFRPFDPKIYRGIKKNPDLGDVIKSKSGKLGFIIHGYGKFKKYFNPQAANDYLTWSGQMLRNMNLINISDTEAVIGFSEGRQAQKAYWFNISGAGRSRKLWKFLGITERQKLKLSDKLGDEYRKIVVEELGKIIIKRSEG